MLETCVLALILCVLAAAQSPTPTPEKPASQATPSPTPPRNSVFTVPTFNVSKIKRPQTEADGGLSILSDTQGVDFGPYVKRMHVLIEDHWFPLMPKAALPPVMKSGLTVIEFAIMPDGSVQNMKITESSGDPELDRAAYGGIFNAAPLPKLPKEFTGPSLLIRAKFFYNPNKKQQQAPVQDKQ
jgi:TonB family protein